MPCILPGPTLDEIDRLALERFLRVSFQNSDYWFGSSKKSTETSRRIVFRSRIAQIDRWSARPGAIDASERRVRAPSRRRRPRTDVGLAIGPVPSSLAPPFQLGCIFAAADPWTRSPPPVGSSLLHTGLRCHPGGLLSSCRSAAAGFVGVVGSRFPFAVVPDHGKSGTHAVLTPRREGHSHHQRPRQRGGPRGLRPPYLRNKGILFQFSLKFLL
jgi:hypothetical protein